MPGTHAVRDRQQYDGNTPNTFCLTHIQLLYGILYTTSSRTSTNTSPITLCKCPELFLVFDNMWSTKHWSRYFVQKNRWLSLTSRTYSLYHTLDDRRWAYLLSIGSYHNMRPIGPANGVDTLYWGLLVKANRFRSPASQKCWPANRLSPSSWRPITRDYWSYIPRHILSTNTLPYFGREAYYGDSYR